MIKASHTGGILTGSLKLKLEQFTLIIIKKLRVNTNGYWNEQLWMKLMLLLSVEHSGPHEFVKNFVSSFAANCGFDR